MPAQMQQTRLADAAHRRLDARQRRLRQSQQLAGFGVVPAGHEYLRLAVRRAPGGPGQGAAIFGECRQTVKAGRIGHPHRRMSAFGVNDEQLEITLAIFVRGVNDIVAGRMEERRP